MLYYSPMKRILLTIPIVLLLCICANAQVKIDYGTVHDGIYINPGFGFRFEYPKDWVVHGEATNERIREIGKEKAVESGAPKASLEVAMKSTYQLLTVFRHPVGTPGIPFNPAIIVVAERVAHAPGIVTGKDYLLNARLLMQKMGAEGLVKDLVEYHFGGSQFFRDDYALVVNGVHVNQVFFVTVRQGYALLFVFMAEDQKTVDEMAKSMETFGPTPPVRQGATTSRPVPNPKPN